MQTTKSEEYVDYNDLTEKSIKLGRYHYIAYIIISLASIAGGSVPVCLSFIQPIVQNEWGLSSHQHELLGSILFLGMFLGGLISGPLSDRYGRRSVLISTLMLQLALGGSSMLIFEYNGLAANRFLFGATLGVIYPVTSVLSSEISPAKVRGTATALITGAISVGKLFGCLIALLLLDSLSAGPWRLMLLFSTAPSLISLLGLYLFVHESARYEVVRGNIPKAVDILNNIGTTNNHGFNKIVLTDVSEGLNSWSQTISYQSKSINLRVIFSRENITKTICFTVLKFCLDFATYGLMFISPFIFNETSKTGSGLQKLAISYIMELPGSILTVLAVDNKHFGRRKSMIITAVMTLGCMMLSVIFFEERIVVAISVARFFLKIGQTLFWIITTESYPTNCRSQAAGVVSGFGRIGSVVAPAMSYYIYTFRNDGPFYLYAGIALMMVVDCLFLPRDMRGQSLDTTGEKTKENEKPNESHESQTEQSPQVLQMKLLQ